MSYGQEKKSRTFYLSPIDGFITEFPTRQTENDEYFASRCESLVWRALLSTGFTIKRQIKVLIKPQGLFYRESFWNCDFGVYKNDELINLIEAKGGIITPEFKLQMQCMDFFNPSDFKKLLITNPYSKSSERIDKILTSLPVKDLLILLKDKQNDTLDK